MYLVDSDVTIDLLASEPVTLEAVAPLLVQGAAISMITYMEVYEGIAASANPRAGEARLRQLLRAIRLAGVSGAVARRCALLRLELRRQGRRVRPRALDLLVAATALEADLTLVTRNTADYRDIPGLALLSP